MRYAYSPACSYPVGSVVGDDLGYRPLGLTNLYPLREEYEAMRKRNPDANEFYVSLSFYECPVCSALVGGHGRTSHLAWHQLNG